MAKNKVAPFFRKRCIITDSIGNANFQKWSVFVPPCIYNWQYLSGSALSLYQTLFVTVRGSVIVEKQLLLSTRH